MSKAGVASRLGAALLVAAVVLLPATAAQAYTRNFYFQGTANANSVKYSSYQNLNGARINGGDTLILTVVAREWANGAFQGQAESASGIAEFSHPSKVYGQAQCYFRSPSFAQTYIQCSWLS